MAIKDLCHDWKTSLVLVLAVASILAPLLMMFGLKTGVILTLRQELLNDPRNLEIILYGNFRLSREFFDALARRPDVGFVLPKTRTLSATLDLVNAQHRGVSAVELIPTGPGDPLLPPGFPIPDSFTEVLVSETLATQLAVQPGDTLLGVLRRTFAGRREVAKVLLKVLEVVPEVTYSQNAVFATVELLVAAEDYRDGYQVTQFAADTGKGLPPERVEFANARLYANDLEAVANIADWVREAGIEVRTQAEKIAGVRAIDRVLSFVFCVIALIGSLGCALALGGALWVNMDRKRRELALLRLFGFSDGGVTLFPIAQSLVIAALAFTLAYAVYLVGATLFNQVLGANLSARGYVSHLFWGDILVAAAITTLVALLAASAGGYRAHQVDPAESLREL